MNAYFLALFLTLVPNSTPQVVASFETERDCRTAAVKANLMPDLQKEDAVKAGAMFACLALVAD